MEKVFFVTNDDLKTVNNELAVKGGRIKLICPVSQSVSSSGGGMYGIDIKGNVYAYVVIEYNEKGATSSTF